MPRSLESAERRFRPRARDWCFRAMAHQRLGQSEEARRCLAEARRWIEQADLNKDDLMKRLESCWAGWEERIIYPLLLREAEAVCAAPPARL